MLGILTFHWADDYGALLQAYALKAYCSKKTDVEILPYVPNGLEKRYRLFKTDTKKELSESIKRVAHIKKFSKMLERRINMRSFRKKHLTTEKSFSAAEKIPCYDKNIKSFIVGSDQIWNPEITNGIADGYFCTFNANADLKCTAYAASIGVDRLDKKYDEQIKNALRNFDDISMREASSVDYISELYGRKVTTALDPVFLLDKNEWDSAMPDINPCKPYIFVYYTEKNADLISFAERLSDEKGLEILVFNQELRNRWSRPVKSMSTVGPLHFLAYMKSADYVVTNSFHGLAFATILQKQFAVFSHSDKNSRLNTLLTASGLQQRVVKNNNSFDIDSQIVWNGENSTLADQITTSRSFLDSKI